MGRKSGWLVLVLLLPLAGFGCASSDPIEPGKDVVLLVPGVGGSGPGYSGLSDGLRAGGVHRPVVTVEWGAPMPFFAMNFSNPEVHEDAEQMLAEKIRHARQLAPGSRIDLIGHSAGCGVVIGALRKLPANVHVQTVILLAPSFSPQFELGAAMSHVDGLTHLFYSDRDDFFLDWRTSHFGTYDGIETKAAGNVGMTKIDSPKFVQHPYDPSWDRLGNDGGHYGPTAEGFARKILAPLLLTPTGKPQ